MYNTNTSGVHTCTANDTNASIRITLHFCVFETISHALVMLLAVTSLSGEDRQPEICLPSQASFTLCLLTFCVVHK